MLRCSKENHKRNLYTSKETSKETYKGDLYTSKETYINQQWPTAETYWRSRLICRCWDMGHYVRRDPWKEPYILQKRPTKETTHVKRDLQQRPTDNQDWFVGAEMGGIMSKETHIHEKSPIKFKSGLQKRLIYVKRDLQQRPTDNRAYLTVLRCEALCQKRPKFMKRAL